MKYLTALVLSLMLAGCGTSVPISSFDHAENKCQASGGLRSMNVVGMFNPSKIIARCVDGSYVEFYLSWDD